MALVAVLQLIFTYIRGRILHTVTLGTMEWRYVFLITISIIPFDMLCKLMVKRRKSIRNTGI